MLDELEAGGKKIIYYSVKGKHGSINYDVPTVSFCLVLPCVSCACRLCSAKNNSQLSSLSNQACVANFEEVVSLVLLALLKL